MPDRSPLRLARNTTRPAESSPLDRVRSPNEDEQEFREKILRELREKHGEAWMFEHRKELELAWADFLEMNLML